MIQLWIALITSLAGQIGGRTEAIVMQLVNAFGTITVDLADYNATVKPWFDWLNAIIDAGRDLTPAEDAALVALADAVHANNVSLANGGEAAPLPPPPAA